MVLIRQFTQVMIKVRLDLSLGFCKKSEAPLVTEFARRHSDGQRADVPKRIQQTGSPAQFDKAVLCPGEMLGFFGRGRRQRLPKLGVTAGESLSLIKRLRADLTDVVDPHQGACVRPFHVG